MSRQIDRQRDMMMVIMVIADKETGSERRNNFPSNISS